MSNNLKNRSCNLHTPKTRKKCQALFKERLRDLEGNCSDNATRRETFVQPRIPFMAFFFQAAVVPKGTIMSFPILLHLPPPHIICIRTISS